MPTLLHQGAFRFWIVMADCAEPRHVHVSGGGGSAKIWLDPVSIASAAGYSRHERQRLERLVQERAMTLRQRWDEECQRAG
jgi:hypothetical protein